MFLADMKYSQGIFFKYYLSFSISNQTPQTVHSETVVILFLIDKQLIDF